MKYFDDLASTDSNGNPNVSERKFALGILLFAIVPSLALLTLIYCIWRLVCA